MTDYLYHHGIKDQKWGVRRFQYPDGSLTPEGRKRYGLKDSYSKSDKKHGKHIVDSLDALHKFKKENSSSDTKKFINSIKRDFGSMTLKDMNNALDRSDLDRTRKWMTASGVLGGSVGGILGGVVGGAVGGALGSATGGVISAPSIKAKRHRREKTLVDLTG